MARVELSIRVDASGAENLLQWAPPAAVGGSGQRQLLRLGQFGEVDPAGLADGTIIGPTGGDLDDKTQL